VRIVIMIVTVAICAYLLAQGAGSLAALTWLPRGLIRERTRGDAAALAALKGEQPPDPHAILARNMFDPLTGPLWPPKEDETAAVGGGDTPGEQNVPTPLGEGQMPPACEGAVRLVAAIFEPRNDDWSFASLSLGATSPLLYRLGSSIESKTVDSIYPEAVFLKSATGTLCSVTMFKPLTPPKPPPPAAAAPADPNAAADAELDQGIKASSETKYSVKRSLVDKLLLNQGELMRSARVVPHEENGRVVGVKLYGIRKTSLFGKLGLQNGDMLRTINGFDMGSPDSALEAYAKLRSASNLSVALVRRGNAVTMEYNIAN